jgi:hypothetical protein
VRVRIEPEEQLFTDQTRESSSVTYENRCENGSAAPAGGVEHEVITNRFFVSPNEKSSTVFIVVRSAYDSKKYAFIPVDITGIRNTDIKD